MRELIGGGVKEIGAVFKIDFEKAYDCVNQNFLIQMLRKIE